MIRLVALALTLLSAPLRAQDLGSHFPALHSVAGVAADDVLNIRAEPDAGAAIIGVLAPGATGVEVMSVTDSGWGLINAGEGAGYVAMRFLSRDPAAPWFLLQDRLTCFGTEPFWALTFDADQGQSSFSTADDPSPQTATIATLWPGAGWSPSAAFALPDGIAVLRPTACGDGMSDRSFGIAVDLFRDGGNRLSGCCALALP